MGVNRVVITMMLGILLLSGYACSQGAAEVPSYTTAGPTNTPISTSASYTPTPKATEPAQCELDRAAIQAATDKYYEANGEWPTADGQPGYIKWDRVVPGFLEKEPLTIGCRWQVSSNPVGTICQSAHC